MRFVSICMPLSWPCLRGPLPCSTVGSRSRSLSDAAMGTSSSVNACIACRESLWIPVLSVVRDQKQTDCFTPHITRTCNVYHHVHCQGTTLWRAGFVLDRLEHAQGSDACLLEPQTEYEVDGWSELLDSSQSRTTWVCFEHLSIVAENLLRFCLRRVTKVSLCCSKGKKRRRRPTRVLPTLWTKRRMQSLAPRSIWLKVWCRCLQRWSKMSLESLPSMQQFKLETSVESCLLFFT